MVANKQPIFPETTLHWKATLTNQVIARDIGTGTPVTLGTAGSNGALIHGIDAIPLGDNVVTTLRIFSKKSSGTQTETKFEFELELPTISGTNDTSSVSREELVLPEIIPFGNRALHLEANESLYCGLGTAVNSGWTVFVRGGHY